MNNGKPKNNRKKNRTPRVERDTGQWDPEIYDVGLRAFERDLPELMKSHPRQWVVYHGERRIGPFKKLEQLDRACEAEGIHVWERVCRVVEPDVIDQTVA